MFSLTHRARLQLERVQSGIWLRHTKTGAVATCDQRGQPALLLLVTAEHHHRVQAEDVHVHSRRAGKAGARG